MNLLGKKALLLAGWACWAPLALGAQARGETAVPSPAGDAAIPLDGRGQTASIPTASREASQAAADLKAAFEAARTRADRLYDQKRYDEAAVALEQALKLAVEAYGDQHIATNAVRHNLAYVYGEIGRYAEAEPLYRQSLRAVEAAQGKADAEALLIRRNLAAMYRSQAWKLHEQKQHAQAAAVAEKNIALLRSLPDENPKGLPTMLHFAASEYLSTGEYAKAEPLFLESLRLWEERVGKGSPEMVPTLQNLAVLYEQTKRYAPAEEILLRILSIAETRMADDPSRLAQALGNLGRLYKKTGRYAQAEAAYTRALGVMEAKFGKESPRLVGLLSDLADVYRDSERFHRAEMLYARCLKIEKGRLGKDHPDLTPYLRNLAMCAGKLGRNSEAEAFLRRGLENEEAKLGKDHPDVAASLNNLAILYESMGRFKEAEPLYLRCLKIRQTRLGADHPDVAEALCNLAMLYEVLDRPPEAERFYLESLKLLEGRLPESRPDVGRTLFHLGRMYCVLEQYAKAQAVFVRRVRMFEETGAKEAQPVATDLNDMAIACLEAGRYARAEELACEVLAIREARLGKDHPATLAAVHNLAAIYQKTGLYAKAAPLMRRELQTLEARGDKDPSAVVKMLITLAEAHYRSGRYGDAEPLYLRCLGIQEARFGKNAPEVATALNNLATLYAERGENGRALPLYCRSVEICASRVLESPLEMATAADNLGMLFRSMGQYDKAREMHQGALMIRESELGPNHPDVAVSLHNLAGVHEAMGQYAETERLLRRAVGIFEQSGERNPRGLCEGLHALALVCWRMNRPAEAESLLLRCLKILETGGGEDDPRLAWTLDSLARAYVHQDRLEEAWPFAERATQLVLKARSFSGRSALQRSAYLGEHATRSLLPCLALKLEKKVDVLKLLEEERAIGLRELLAESRARASDLLPEADRARFGAVMARMNALHAALEERANARQPIGELPLLLQRAEMEYDALMAELSTKYEPVVAAETHRATTSERVVESPALDGDTAVVGWVEYHNWAWGYVIRRSGVRWIDLSEGFDPDRQADLAGLALVAGWEPSQQVLAPANLAALYRCRLAPLVPHLQGIRNLIVIAQGWSAQLPVEMLLTHHPSDPETDMVAWPWLGNQYRISYAPSATALDMLCRQRGRRAAKKWSRPLFALADPPFSDEHLSAMNAEKASGTGPPVVSVGGSGAAFAAVRDLLRSEGKAALPRLPGSRREVTMVAGVLGRDRSLLLLGPEASERRLFEVSQSGGLTDCRYIHFATHGFADADRPELSGLILARVPPDTQYDGLLQMREVFHLKLDADLVVLSACQTGRGKHLSGEGVVGLSTAFFFAGTPSLVVSLWNAPDMSTALLMRRFYQNLQAGRTKAEALGEAKAWLRNLTREELARFGQAPDPALRDLSRSLGPVLEAEKGRPAASKPFAHPHYWAGFILMGDPL